jgi:hypothetical protein
MTPPDDLLARREQLKLRSARLRDQIARRAQVLNPALHLADRVRAQPWLALAGAAALGALAARPKGAVLLGLRLWSGWQAVRRAKPLLYALFGRR